MSTKEIYFKEASNNYYNIMNDDIAYCVSCYGINNIFDECIVNTNNISWIITNCERTASCRKCFTDSIISKNYFKNKSDEEIKKELEKFYNCLFSIEL